MLSEDEHILNKYYNLQYMNNGVLLKKSSLYSYFCSI